MEVQNYSHGAYNSVYYDLNHKIHWAHWNQRWVDAWRVGGGGGGGG